MTGPACRRDRGAVLPLVLVLIVIAGLIVVPVMAYTASVLRANSVVTSKTKQLEAAKGGLRAALGDPKEVFETCVAADVDLDPEPIVNDYVVDNQCWLVDDVGSIEALSGQIPYGSVSLQLGSEVPSHFVEGVAGTVDPVAESAPDADWWEGVAADLPTDGTVWMPHLPRQPTVARTGEPFDMPPAFGCQVFFPGHYTDPLDLSPDNPAITASRLYFASGVYSFEQPITVSGDIDIVVGYGTEDFGDSCADDIQVAANVLDDPGSFAIDGGGATWVFGDQARLVVDDSAGSPSIRFNQRYSGKYSLAALPYEGFDRGRRINIMTVNGDARLAGADHDPLDVNVVRRSRLITSAGTVDDDDPSVVTEPASFDDIDSGSTYQPSSIDLTDAARRPDSPQNLTAVPYEYDESGIPAAALLVSWDAVTGQATGGALLTGYDVSVVPAPPPPHDDVCPAERQVAYDDSGTPRIVCLVRGLTAGVDYDIEVTASNTSSIDATSDPATTVETAVLGDPIDRPLPPTGVTVEVAAGPDDAIVSWAPPTDNGGAPVTRYDVDAVRVYTEPGPNLAPTAESTVLDLGIPPTATTRTFEVPASDPNGDALSVSVDDSLLPPDGTVQVVAGPGLEVEVSVDPLAVPGVHVVPYTVADPDGLADNSAAITLNIGLPPGSSDPVVGTASLNPSIGVDTVVHVPGYDPDLESLTMVVVADPARDPSDWNEPFPVSGLDMTINTTAPDGTYLIDVVVEDDGGRQTTGTVEVVVARGAEHVGACAAVASPPEPLSTRCMVAGLPTLPPTDGSQMNLGYRFEVRGDNGVGVSDPAATGDPYVFAFVGGGTDIEPFVAMFEPHRPVPVIEIDADDPTNTATVSIPGYVAVPMGTIAVRNAPGDPVSMTGGVLAGRFDVPDTWSVPNVGGGTPVGFWDQIVLQRTVRIVSVAGNARSVAVVQVNRDNELYSINSWTVQ